MTYVEKTVVIDPGKQGAAIAFCGMEPVASYYFKACEFTRGIDNAEFYEWLEHYAPDNIFIEKIDSIPHQGVKSTATQFFVYGQTYATCLMANELCVIVDLPTQSWTTYIKKLSYKLEPTILKSKEAAYRVASAVYPDFVEQHRKTKNVPDCITDCLAMFLYAQTLNIVY